MTGDNELVLSDPPQRYTWVMLPDGRLQITDPDTRLTQTLRQYDPGE